MQVGDVVLAVGNPLGIGQTVTMGIISAKGRSTGVGDGSYEDFLQTDAPINHGNSGGALVNTKGELVGINSQILSVSDGNIGIGFAIPANMARHVMDELRNDGQVRARAARRDGPAGHVGHGREPRPEGGARRDRQLGDAWQRGGTRGREAGRRHQVVQRPAGAATPTRCATAWPEASPGSSATRRHHPRRQREDADREARRSGRQSSGARRRGRWRRGTDKTALGVSVAPLTPELAARAGVRRDLQGLVVQDVDPDGRAADAGIQAGDVINEVNRQPVTNVDELRRRSQLVRPPAAAARPSRTAGSCS